MTNPPSNFYENFDPNKLANQLADDVARVNSAAIQTQLDVLGVLGAGGQSITTKNQITFAQLGGLITDPAAESGNIADLFVRDQFGEVLKAMAAVNEMTGKMRNLRQMAPTFEALIQSQYLTSEAAKAKFLGKVWMIIEKLKNREGQIAIDPALDVLMAGGFQGVYVTTGATILMLVITLNKMNDARAALANINKRLDGKADTFEILAEAYRTAEAEKQKWMSELNAQTVAVLNHQVQGVDVGERVAAMQSLSKKLKSANSTMQSYSNSATAAIDAILTSRALKATLGNEVAEFNLLLQRYNSQAKIADLLSQIAFYGLATVFNVTGTAASMYTSALIGKLSDTSTGVVQAMSGISDSAIATLNETAHTAMNAATTDVADADVVYDASGNKYRLSEDKQRYEPVTE